MDQSGEVFIEQYLSPNRPNYAPPLTVSTSLPDGFGYPADNLNLKPIHRSCVHLTLTDCCCCHCCEGCRDLSRVLFQRGCRSDDSRKVRKELDITDIKYHPYTRRATIEANSGHYVPLSELAQFHDFNDSGASNRLPSSRPAGDDSIWSSQLSHIRSMGNNTEQEDLSNYSLSQQTVLFSPRCSQAMSQSMEIVRRVRELDED